MVNVVNIIEELKSLNRIKMTLQEEVFGIFNFSIASTHRTDRITKTMPKFLFLYMTELWS